jgi:hypothetical protein
VDALVNLNVATLAPSRLFPGTRLAYADLHNHTHLSDGEGDPSHAFPALRRAGLHIAALTDHARVNGGINEAAWRLTAALADAADLAGAFTAIRGFEWTSDELGHINVWYSSDWTIPGPDGVGALYRWLRSEHALAGFNHPGREPGRLSAFAFDPQASDRLVTFEIFNRRDDYLFRGCGDGCPSPLVECLDAGWRPGLIGVSDEHGTQWGCHGKGRAGVWVTELSRAGVRAALRGRSVYATTVHDLRLDAAATVPGGRPIRMGDTLLHGRGMVRFAVDLEGGAELADRPLELQVLRPGRRIPTVAHVETVGALPTTVRFAVNLDRVDGNWVVLRLADPSGPPPPGSSHDHAAANLGLAYASPFWLDLTDERCPRRRTRNS